MYLGLVDDEEYDEYEPYEEVGAPAPAPRRNSVADAGFEPEPIASSGGVRTLHREAPDSGVTIQTRPAVVRPITTVQSPKVHVVAPVGFNDAQEIGDKLKANQPVIVNLQGANRDLARRLIDFASGLTYALDGGMQRIADKVFLLTPRNVEVSAEERARLIEKGFFNQS